jgi:hypothetical protein
MFTTPCFIRKNTPEIINRLKELRIPHNDYDNGDRPWIAFNYGMWISVDEGHNKLFPDEIDCGENEELFLALAALRDDTDKNQWVIDEANECFGWENSWSICDKDDMNERVVYTHYRKASVKEIIENLKDK